MYLAAGLGVLALLPLTGAVRAQSQPFRPGFIPYVPPGQWRPALNNTGINGVAGVAGNTGNMGVNAQGGFQVGGGGFQVGGGIGGIGGGGFNIGGGIGGGGFQIGGGLGGGIGGL
ncbi:MAG TPA: hypothetical protein VM529_01245, partial [Gemmata sp.]|nr:hypothetical protein [Gemmata sp.]